jgi:ribosomal-protein-alanine N-acetyltransferase
MFFQKETERFVIKTLIEEDVGQEYLSWFDQKNVKEYIYYKLNEHDRLEDLKKYVSEKSKDKNVIFLGVFNKENIKEHIGNIKFEPVDVVHKTAVMGILIGNEKWKGKGVGSEALSGAHSIIKNLGIVKVFLGVEKTNDKAISLYERCGYEYDETNYLKLNLDQCYCMFKILN